MNIWCSGDVVIEALFVLYLSRDAWRELEEVGDVEVAIRPCP